MRVSVDGLDVRFDAGMSAAEPVGDLGHGRGAGGPRSQPASSPRLARGPEFPVDVVDVRVHGGTADAELVADGGERSIRGEKGQDAGLGRRQETVLRDAFLRGGVGWLVMVL